MKKRILTSIFLGFSLGASVASLPIDEQKPLKEAVTPLRYTLGPGDLISLHVTDLDDVSDKPVRIDPSGTIDLPLVGRVQAAGITVEQLRSELSKQLTKYIQSPQIAINVVEYHSQPVSVLGAVNTPGIQQLQSPKRILDVISVAGGLKAEAGSRLTITREMRWGALPLPNARLDSSGQFSIAEVNLDELTKSQNPRNNILVLPNDTLSIPKAEIVYVLGEVKKSGGFPLVSHERISIIKALALAEGLDRDAAPKRARIVRASEVSTENSKEVPVDIAQILAGKAPDVELSADDVLFIPNNAARSATRRAAEAALQIATGVVIYRH